MRRALAALGLALLGGCRRAPPAEDPRALYDLRCAPCHGAQGRGDGPMAAELSPRPRDLSDPAWQTRVDDVYIRKVIVNGGLGVGLSARMPGSPDLAERPATLAALVQVVRSMKPR